MSWGAALINTQGVHHMPYKPLQDGCAMAESFFVGLCGKIGDFSVPCLWSSLLSLLQAANMKTLTPRINVKLSVFEALYISDSRLLELRTHTHTHTHQCGR